MPTNPDLWRRLAAWRFDGEDGFVAKLARENGWTQAHASRVVEEYRRYAYLACVAGHMVVPSENVDQAWHLHLLDTEEYWQHFCPDVLGRPLHHRPSRGGVEDRRRHVECYEQTLATYEQEFGHPPPPDVWPPAGRRFGRDLRQRRVALADYWIVPKQPLKSVATAGLVVAGGALLVGAAPLYVASAGPLDWDGPTFLSFYAAMFIVALAASLFLRWRLYSVEPATRSAFGRDRDIELDPYEAAILHRKTHLAINAAVAALIRDHSVRIAEQKGSLLRLRSRRYGVVRTGPLRDDAVPLERAVYEKVPAEAHGIEIGELHRRVQPMADAIVASLQSRGLLLPPGSAFARLTAALPLLALAGLGAMKLGVGLMRDRPVAWLAIFLVATLVTALLLFARGRRTTAGSQVLRAWKQRIGSRRIEREGDVRDGRELAWIVALYGLTVLHAEPLKSLHAAVRADPSAGGSSAGGACGGGCGGGGGGGCGGGGCGGCGGG